MMANRETADGDDWEPVELRIVGGDDEEETGGETAARPLFHPLPFQKICTSSEQYHNQSNQMIGAASSEDARWYATEKIHGAQLQIYARRRRVHGGGDDDGDGPSFALIECRAAKRSGWLDPHESFFGYQEVLHRLAGHLAAFIRHATKSGSATVPAAADDDADDGTYVVLYGELFGGYNSAATSTGSIGGSGGGGPAAAVQQGVYYSPRHEFAVFDAAVVRSSAATSAPMPTANGVAASLSKASSHLLPFSRTLALCEAAGLFTVPVLATAATYEPLAHFDLSFDSAVPQALNRWDARHHHKSNHLRGDSGSFSHDHLPLTRDPLPPGSNTAEGIVVRPDAPAATCTYKGAPVRPLVKHKHPSFSEVEAIEHHHAAEDPSVLVRRVYAACLTRNRVAAVVSKLGDSATVAAITEALAEDVENDFWDVAPAAYQRAFGCLSSAALDDASAWLRKQAAQLVVRTAATVGVSDKDAAAATTAS